MSNTALFVAAFTLALKNFLLQNVRVKMTETVEILLYRCINLLLGPENLQKTKLLTSTKKCEAVNRSYQAVTPKATTFSRNHRGRIHGQVHKLNHGFANSALIKCGKLNALITKGSSVVKQLASNKKCSLGAKAANTNPDTNAVATSGGFAGISCMNKYIIRVV